jgi:signal transduction histidine kinase/CheY-like chemotaxis protein
MQTTSRLATPRPQPAAGALASATAADLIEHTFQIDAGETVESADQIMQATRHEYAAVVADGRVIGICSRSMLRQMVGGRYGFALHARDHVRAHLNAVHHMFNGSTPLRSLLDVTLAREDEEFYHDAVIVDDEQRLIGLVSTLRLVRAQSQLMADQYLLLDRQRAELEEVNDSLRESLELQQKLERQVVQEAKSALLQSLAGGIAHEINNKLVPIMGYAELMAQQAAVWGDAEFEEYCVTVRTCALESAQIIRQLLELSKPSAPALVPLDLRKPIEQAMTFTQLRIKESDTTFDLELPEIEVNVLADATQIKQLIVNLVLNAVDAMRRSDVRRLTVRLTASGDSATLVVRDSGSGISMDSIDRIFDPFFTTKDLDEGTGLGLSVCSAIVRQHDGTIAVESTLGRGTAFTVTLPLGRPTAVSPTPTPAGGVRTQGPAPADWRGRPVLVVDDEVGSGQLVKHALERTMGLNVTWVTDGELAVGRLLEHDYALVVSDMRMPKLNGMELLAWIKEHRPAMTSRILFITGDAGADRIDTVKRAGVRLLLKPFKVDALAQECRTILANAGKPA